MLKSLLKQVTPPIIWDALRSRIIPARPAVTYEGQFRSFEEVRAAYADFTNYHSPASALDEAEAALRKKKCFEDGRWPEDSQALTRLNFLPTLLTVHPGKTISVLDVGGGYGEAFLSLKAALPARDLRVTVVELPATVERAAEVFSDDPGIRFFDRIPEGNEKFDAVHFGSSLQYFENYREILDRVIALNPGLIVISDTTMGEAETFVAAQVNMAGRAIPRLVFNRAEVTGHIVSQGFDLLHVSANFSGGLDFANYEPPISATAHWNLVFGSEK